MWRSDPSAGMCGEPGSEMLITGYGLGLMMTEAQEIRRQIARQDRQVALHMARREPSRRPVLPTRAD